MTGMIFLNRRSFIKGLVGVGTLLAAGCSLNRDNKAATGENIVNALREFSGELPVEFVQQIITDDPNKTRRIVWQTNKAYANQTVEIRTTGEANARQIPVQNASFSDDGKNFHLYTARFEPNGAVEYRICAADLATPWKKIGGGSSNENFKAIIFPDSQSADYSVWAATAKAAAPIADDAAFFVNMGDIVDNGEASEQWRAWFDGIPAPLRDIPFVPIMGNHETYDRNWQVRLPEAYLNYFPVPDNGNANFSRYYYSFDVGATHFVVLNTQWEETEKFKPGLMTAQQNWLRADMRRRAKKWNIALLHKDVLQYRINGRPERQEGFSDVGENFMPLFTELNFDAVLTAHLHTLRDRGRIKNFAKDDGDGPLYILTGLAGDVRYPGLWVDHAFDEYVAPQPETDNFLTLEINDNKLTVAAFLPNGTELFRRDIVKDA